MQFDSRQLKGGDIATLKYIGFSYSGTELEVVMNNPVENIETWKAELKNVKIAGGDETTRFEASLYLNGKKIAIASNEGSGGNNKVDFFIHRDPTVARQHAENWRQYFQHLQTVELEPNKFWLHYQLQGYLAMMTELSGRTWQQSDIDQDMVIDELLHIFQLTKKLTAKRNAGKIFAVNRLERNGLYQLSDKAYSQESASQIKADLARMLAERYGTPVTPADITILNAFLNQNEN